MPGADVDSSGRLSPFLHLEPAAMVRLSFDGVGAAWDHATVRTSEQSVNVPPQSSVMVAAMGPVVVVRLPMLARAVAMPAHVEAAAIAEGVGGHCVAAPHEDQQWLVCSAPAPVQAPGLGQLQPAHCKRGRPPPGHR